MLLPDCGPWKLFLSSQAFVQRTKLCEPLRCFSVFHAIVLTASWSILNFSLFIIPFEPVCFSLTPVSSFPPTLRFLPFTLFHLSTLHRPEAVASSLETRAGLSLRYSPQPLPIIPHRLPQMWSHLSILQMVFMNWNSKTFCKPTLFLNCSSCHIWVRQKGDDYIWNWGNKFYI